MNFMKNHIKKVSLICLAFILLILAGFQAYKSTANLNTYAEQKSSHSIDTNPLRDYRFYTDNTRKINQLKDQYTNSDNMQDAALINKISGQPGSTWLNGPSSSDPSGNNDISEVERTSQEAASQKTVPIYIVYAIPNRDSCSSYSKGGFSTDEEYLTWIDGINNALNYKAVFVLEPDAIAHTLNSSCLSSQQRSDRYALLKAAVTKLKSNNKVLAIYLDTGNAEWLPDPSMLKQPLEAAGISEARGIAVNVSQFIDNKRTISWSQTLIHQFGQDKGIIIDTSRNGNGPAPENVKGEARWCNPHGRAIGVPPSTQVRDKSVDAFFWGKNIGESDGSCFGYPPAGTFVPQIALDLARNAGN
jgi:endoglucanase